MRTHDIHTHVNSTKRAVYVRFCIILKSVYYVICILLIRPTHLLFFWLNIKWKQWSIIIIATIESVEI